MTDYAPARVVPNTPPECLVHGLLILNKPVGPSSAQMLRRLAPLLPPGTRIGHAGTLDPFATGVLLVLLGDATRLATIATALPKVYDAEILLGRRTDTLDPTGKIVEQGDPGPYRPDALMSALGGLTGMITQIPPLFSAVRVGGKRAYKMARRAQAIELKARTVRIDHIGIRAVRWPLVRLAVRCGAGTYIRALARDLGAALGVPAMLPSLCRTRVGPFDVADAVCFARDGTPPSAQTIIEHIMDPLAITRAAGLGEIDMSPTAAATFAAGLAPIWPPSEESPLAVLTTIDGTQMLLGLAKVEHGRLRPSTILAHVRAQISGRVKT